MTAPLSIRVKEEAVLPKIVNGLLDAISENNIEQTEISMGEILNQNVPEVTIWLFYTYAKLKEKEIIGDYFKSLLVIIYNIDTEKEN